MRHRFKKDEVPESFNIWTAFTDLMSNAFIILALLLIFVTLKLSTSVVAPPSAPQTNSRTAPPYIVISDIEGNYFDPGKSDLGTSLKSYIEGNVVNKIESAINQYRINLIEVIGHTDGQPVGSSDQGVLLDQGLEEVALTPYTTPVPKTLRPLSNADLGLMRALEVVRFLKAIQNDEQRLKGIDPLTGFRAYSAAQLTLISGEFASKNDRLSVQQRRRIEIRLTRLGEQK
jgi:hypothetical protein